MLSDAYLLVKKFFFIFTVVNIGKQKDVRHEDHWESHRENLQDVPMKKEIDG
jgi:hypothetical protein